MKNPLNLLENEIDSIQQKGFTMVKQMLKDLLLSLVRPLATMTEVLYREDLGERYFTGWNVFVGVFLLILGAIPLPTLPLGAMTAMERQTASAHSMSLANILSILWLVVFVLCCWRQRQSLRRRYREGIVWHSYSHGTGLFGDPVPEIYQGLLVLAFGVLLACFGVYLPGMLLIASGYISCQMRANEMRRFHNQVLDAIDARIVSENLSKAIMAQSKPEDTEGFSAPLPAYVSDKFRERFLQKETVPVETPEPITRT